MSDPKLRSSARLRRNGVVIGVESGVVHGAESAGMFVPLEGLLPTCPLLTVEEAAGVLRISRTLAYQLAGEYPASGGKSGLPCVRIAGCVRVPRWALLTLALTGKVVPLGEVDLADVIGSQVGAEVGLGNLSPIGRPGPRGKRPAPAAGPDSVGRVGRTAGSLGWDR